MPQPPKDLVDLQDWFSSGIHESTHKESRRTNEEIQQFITASDQQTAKERYDIYVQDYWPRCLQSLRDDFPCLWHHWGKETFFEIMTVYLAKFPSRSYTLFYLGQDMVSFLQDTYTEADKEKIISSAQYDWARMVASFSKVDAAFNPDKINPSDLPEIPLTFQAHVSLLKLPMNYYEWEKDGYPKEGPNQTQTTLVVYQKNGVEMVSDLSSEAFEIFEAIKTHGTLNKAMSNLSLSLEPSQVQNALQWAVEQQLFSHPKGE